MRRHKCTCGVQLPHHSWQYIGDMQESADGPFMLSMYNCPVCGTTFSKHEQETELPLTQPGDPCQRRSPTKTLIVPLKSHRFNFIRDFGLLLGGGDVILGAVSGQFWLSCLGLVLVLICTARIIIETDDLHE